MPIKHQYFLERADGTRVSISYEQAELAVVSKRFFRWIDTTFMTVIRAVGGVKSKPEPMLRYGGRVNVKSPTGYRGN